MFLSEYTSAVRGRKSELARILNLPAQLIGQWANGIRPVPVERCTAIEAATKGAVTRQDLRPNDWQLIWPELKNKKEAAHG